MKKFELEEDEYLLLIWVLGVAGGVSMGMEFDEKKKRDIVEPQVALTNKIMKQGMSQGE